MDRLDASRESRTGYIAILFDRMRATIRSISATRNARAETRAGRIGDAEMISLGDHVLRDIGLTRGQTNAASLNAHLRFPRV
ncbi:hypothetical protein R5H32_19980 [Defluviimonas sp. D31]|uniref:hypothetical protein n=1 Tax=Defluviimonas sp. D31 TaxID=3083253 RepID=UPI00296EF78E|nr:hypothetical protein [Defluviimonas sp. D31]MDW4551621.1 hypothetical protein [Defluviimonas sp. D31]